MNWVGRLVVDEEELLGRRVVETRKQVPLAWFGSGDGLVVRWVLMRSLKLIN